MRKKFLSVEQKEEIYQKHHRDGYPLKNLAVMYDVSFNTVYRICNPEIYEAQKLKNKEYRLKNKEKIKLTEKNNYYSPKIKFHTINDKEIIEKLKEQDNLNNYIRTLILKDIESEER